MTTNDGLRRGTLCAGYAYTSRDNVYVSCAAEDTGRVIDGLRVFDGSGRIIFDEGDAAVLPHDATDDECEPIGDSGRPRPRHSTKNADDAIRASNVASGHNGISVLPGDAKSRRTDSRIGFCCATAELLPTACCSPIRWRAWYCRSIADWRFPYFPSMAMSAPRAIRENIATQNQGESVTGGCSCASMNSF